MNETDLKVKQQIVDKIKSSTNILVTVSRDPSVDELSAALGLATLLNKLDKHATAIFSGTVPPAINFLNPEKVFENSADSLRDFIIALDKEKADHLRYKVEGDVVKIFITPYRTVITGDDLQFSQGDFNIELVLALGVDSQEHIDAALEAHGRILHDVTVATLSAGEKISQLGSLDWHDQNASSLSEMVAGIGESLKSEKPLLDKQIATALLTGIVAATDRFSNTRTTARVMTMAADLMAAGADQQLIAAKLQESHEINSSSFSVASNVTDTSAPAETVVEGSTLPPTGGLDIPHEPINEVPQDATSTISTIAEPNVSTIADAAPVLATSLPQPEANDYSTSTLAPAYAPEMPSQNLSSIPPETNSEPVMGGTLNSTSDQAAEDARRELDDKQNKTILTHSYLGAAQTILNENPINGVGQTEDPQNVDIFANPPVPAAEPAISLPLPPPQMPDFSTLPPPPLPDFNAPVPDPSANIDSPQPVSNDPSQFRIPGQ